MINNQIRLILMPKTKIEIIDYFYIVGIEDSSLLKLLILM